MLSMLNNYRSNNTLWQALLHKAGNTVSAAVLENQSTPSNQSDFRIQHCYGINYQCTFHKIK